MKIKALSFIIAFSIITSISFAQQKKIDIDKFKRRMEFLGLPSSNKLVGFKSYSVSFNAQQESLNKLEITPKDIENYFRLEGYSYLKEGDGDFVYSIQIGEPTVVKEEVVETVVEVKNADGTKTNTTKYIAVVELSVPTAIQLINNETGEVIYAAVLSLQTSPSIFKSEPSTKEGAAKVLTLKTAGLQMNVKQNYIDALNAAVRRVKTTFAFEKQGYDQEFMDVDVNKSPELTNLHNEIVQVTNALANASYREPLQRVQLALEPLLSSWLASADKLNSADKYEKKLKFVYLYNAAVAQFWLEKFDDALSTSEKIVQNDYNTYEAGIIKENVKQVREYLAKNKYSSRHQYRAAFYSNYNYTYTKQPLEKKQWGIVAKTQKDFKELEDIAKGVKNTAKQLVDDLTLGDSILANNAFYSTLKFTMDGVPYEYKKGSLSAGKGRPGTDGYYISCHQREGLVVKQGEFKGIDIVLYPKDTNKVATSVNNIKALITKNKGIAIGDIYTGSSSFDSVPYKLNGQKLAPKIISWEQYGKALAGEIEIMFSTTNGDDFYSYKTMNGDEFQMELISATPIVVKGNAMVSSQGYMAKFRIPSVVLRRFYYGHYTPLYGEEQKELKDVEFYIVLR